MKLGEGEFILLLIASFIILFYISKQATLLLLIISSILWIQKNRKYLQYWKERGIPGPEPNFFFRNIFSYVNGIKEADIRNQEKYGSLYGIFNIFGPELITSDVNILKQVLVKDFTSFTNHLDINVETEESIFAKMITTLKDKRWNEVRNIITPSLSSGKLKAIIPLIENSIETTKDVVRQCIVEKNGKLNVKKVMGNLVIDIISKSAFGMDMKMQSNDSPEKDEFINKADDLFNISLTDIRIFFIILCPNIAYLVQKFFKYEVLNNSVSKYFRTLIQKVINERLQNPTEGKPDFLQMLINASVLRNTEIELTSSNSNRISNVKSVEWLKEIEVIAQIFVFFIGGYETTASTLQFIIYSLAVNPKIQQKAFEEIIDNVGQEGRITYEAISKMSYIDQIIHETMRLYPVTGRINRICGSDTIINGVKCTKDTAFTIPIFAIHNDPKIYPEPEKFNPDRFSAEECSKRSPLSFLPFGFGRRNCIGKRLALLEIRMIVASLLREFKFSTTEYPQGSLLPISSVGMTLPMKPVCVNVSERI